MTEITVRGASMKQAVPMEQHQCLLQRHSARVLMLKKASNQRCNHTSLPATTKKHLCKSRLLNRLNNILTALYGHPLFTSLSIVSISFVMAVVSCAKQHVSGSGMQYLQWFANVCR
jgi:hypothetical protein